MTCQLFQTGTSQQKQVMVYVNASLVLQIYIDTIDVNNLNRQKKNYVNQHRPCESPMSCSWCFSCTKQGNKLLRTGYFAYPTFGLEVLISLSKIYKLPTPGNAFYTSLFFNHCDCGFGKFNFVFFILKNFISPCKTPIYISWISLLLPICFFRLSCSSEDKHSRVTKTKAGPRNFKRPPYMGQAPRLLVGLSPDFSGKISILCQCVLKWLANSSW